jgi:hypothetical protein
MYSFQTVMTFESQYMEELHIIVKWIYLAFLQTLISQEYKSALFWYWQSYFVTKSVHSFYFPVNIMYIPE